MAKAKDDAKTDAKKASGKAEITFDAVITAFETRYDYQSARIMAEEALTKAGLDKNAKYGTEDIKKLSDVVTNLDERTTTIIEALNALIA